MSEDLKALETIAGRIVGRAEALRDEVGRLERIVAIEPSMDEIVSGARRRLLEAEGKRPVQIEAELLARHELPSNDALLGILRMVRATRTLGSFVESLALLMCVLPPERCRILAREFSGDLQKVVDWIARGERLTMTAVRALRQAVRVYQGHVRHDPADLVVQRVLGAIADPRLRERVVGRLEADLGERGHRMAVMASRPPTLAEIVVRLSVKEMQAVLRRLALDVVVRFIAMSPPEARERLYLSMDKHTADGLRGRVDINLLPDEVEAVHQAMVTAIVDAVARGEVRWPTGLPQLEIIPGAERSTNMTLDAHATSGDLGGEELSPSPYERRTDVGSDPPEIPITQSVIPAEPEEEETGGGKSRTSERIVGGAFLALAAAGYLAATIGDQRFSALTPVPEITLAVGAAVSVLTLTWGESSLIHLFCRLFSATGQVLAIVGLGVATLVLGLTGATPWTAVMAIAVMATMAGKHDGWEDLPGQLAFLSIASAGLYPPWAQAVVHAVLAVFVVVFIGAEARGIAIHLQSRRAIRGI
ncbi:MAG: hypothetical protein WCJ64_15230, partial [Rhodospirillaceae bacterium]